MLLCLNQLINCKLVFKTFRRSVSSNQTNFYNNKIGINVFKQNLLTSFRFRVSVRHESSVNSNSKSKSKAEIKSESVQKLAQMQNNFPIICFPLFNHNKECDIKELLPSELKHLCECVHQSSDDFCKHQYFPSVTNVLSDTMSAQSLAMLERWKRMKILELGEEGFKAYQQLLFARGKLIHLNIRKLLEGQHPTSISIDAIIENFWKSLQHVFPVISDIKLCETFVSHPYLCYRGIVDCVGVYNGNIVIIEWKTSEKPKPTLNDIYDNPLQAAAYMGALNFDNNHSLYANEIVLIYAYENGSNAQIHHLNQTLCEQYWQQWLKRLTTFWTLKAKLL